MRRIRRDIEFIYFVDHGSTMFAGPYANKQPTRGGTLRKFKLVEVPLDQPKANPNKNVLYKKKIDGYNILITNGEVEDILIYDAHVLVKNMKLEKNHTGFDDKEMEKEFCCQLIDIKNKYGS